ncbi:MAG: FAD-dependent monooxygenase [Pseudomonadota bacterium]
MAQARNIIVVGGGIGGLAAALAFRKSGAFVTVVEQADELREVGAGLQISPNGMRVLDALGVGKALRARSTLGSSVSLRRAENDHEVARLRLDQKTPYAFVHRADLIDILADAVRSAGVALRLGCKVKHIAPGDTPAAILEDGTTLVADVIVEASGLRSGLRRLLNPAQLAFFTGQVAWRAIVPNTAARGPQVHVHMAPGQHLVSYPLRSGEILNLVAIQERRDWVKEGWTHEDDPANLRAAFSGACDAVQEMLRRVERVHLWGLHRHEVAKVWSRQNTVLLGDAAHPTLPFLAQGANMALEDAWALAACVRSEGADGLQSYQALRETRVTRAIETANGNAKRYHLPRGPVRLGAHAGLKLVSSLAPRLMTAPFAWLYDYDVTKAAPM